MAPEFLRSQTVKPGQHDTHLHQGGVIPQKESCGIQR
jgi:hypothetical protein